MTDIRIIYDPFEKKVSVYIDGEELHAKENKICAFLRSNPFLDCLEPLRKRYLIWNGLLPELISEVNDDELRIIFEGRASDYLALKKSFIQSMPLITQLGYTNNWMLDHVGNFESEHMAEVLASVARDLREMCESRAELGEVDRYLRQLGKTGSIEKITILADMVAGHVEKWETSGSPYSEEKMMYLNLLLQQLDELKKRLKNHSGR